MIPLNWASIQWGRVASMKFGGYPDTTVTFVPWKTPPTSLDGVRVIITPNNTRLPESVSPNHPAAPVAVIDEVNPSGFVFHAVNVDGLDGEAGFDWMAVEEMSGPQLGHEASIDVRFGIGQPRTLGHGGAIGDWAAYTASFGATFATGTPDELIRLLTAHNFGETAVSALAVDATQAEQDARFQITNGGVARNTVAAVGITCEQFSNPMRGMAYIARSADDVDGKVGFNWLVLSGGEVNRGGMIDTGVTESWPQFYKAIPNLDSWEYRTVDFAAPFDSPPIVLVTGAQRLVMPAPMPPRPVAVAGIVFNTTRFGFTIAGRNIDIGPGQTQFYWVAIGCGGGCGGG